jgi:ornithine cyclodeaminase
MNSLLLLRGEEVRELLTGREAEVMEAVGRAYLAHGEGDSSLPHSTFLRFPDDPGSRIIALPAYVGGPFRIAGMKWIASFPRNLEAGVDRASAAIILNSADTGRPLAIMEGSIVSAQRTAASAALAAAHLHRGLPAARVGLVGCGPIGFEIVRLLRVVFPELRGLLLFDLDPARAEYFGARCREEFGPLDVEVAGSTRDLLASVPLAAFATTALQPHVASLPAGPRPMTILHVSLRDLAPEVVLASDNVVDDVDHVCRAQTSVHLASERSGGCGFVRCTIADVLSGRAPTRGAEDGVTIFSPFGLGILDLAVADLVYRLAREREVGTAFDGFIASGWRGEAPR